MDEQNSIRNTQHSVDTASVRVSLDVESVLVDTFSYFIPVYNERHDANYGVSDIDCWEWAREEVEWEHFDGLIHEGWQDPVENMEPKEEDLASVVNDFASHDLVQLDIVTARTGVENKMLEWLSHHGITQFNQFRATEIPKSEFDYNVFIDDKPGLANTLGEKQLQYLVVGPHNKSMVDHEDVIAVDTVSEAMGHMSTHMLVSEGIDEYW